VELTRQTVLQISTMPKCLIRLALFLGVLFAAPAIAQQSIPNAPIPPQLATIGLTATTASGSTVVLPSAPSGVTRTFLYIYNYATTDYGSNQTMWIAFGATCTSGSHGEIELLPGSSIVYGGQRSLAYAQNVPQTFITICTSSASAVGGLQVQ
jgi:hypothetical protein